VALRFWLFQRPTIDFHEVCPCASARTVEDEYDIKVFEVVLQALAERYFPAFDRLHEWFLMKRLET
jgi:hypothetical protein